MDKLQYARCIDCKNFGTHGAHCDLKGKQGLCSDRACVFFQWKEDGKLRHMDGAYFFPVIYEEEMVEMRLRGMEGMKEAK